MSSRPHHQQTNSASAVGEDDAPHGQGENKRMQTTPFALVSFLYIRLHGFAKGVV